MNASNVKGSFWGWVSVGRRKVKEDNEGENMVEVLYAHV
jgi:hypothetical protein